jgi:hypothetical protein
LEVEAVEDTKMGVAQKNEVPKPAAVVDTQLVAPSFLELLAGYGSGGDSDDEKVFTQVVQDNAQAKVVAGAGKEKAVFSPTLNRKSIDDILKGLASSKVMLMAIAIKGTKMFFLLCVTSNKKIPPLVKYPSQKEQVSNGGICKKKAKPTSKKGSKPDVEYEPDTYFEPRSIVDALHTDKEIWVWVRHVKNPVGNKLKKNRVPVDEGTNGVVRSRVAALYKDAPSVVEELLRKDKYKCLAPIVKKHLEEQSGTFIKDEDGKSTKIKFIFKERAGLTTLVDEAQQKEREKEAAAERARAQVSSVCVAGFFSLTSWHQ